MKNVFYLLLLAICLGACKNYGDKVKKGNIEVYYKEGITKEQAEKTAELLYNSIKGTAAAESRKSMQLIKGNGDTLLFRMVVDKKKLADAKDENFIAIATALSEGVFDGKPVNVDLTNNSFKTIRSITFVQSGAEEYGEKITSGNIEVYNDGTSTQLAYDLAGFLDRYMDPSNKISFQLSKNGEYIVKMVSDESKVSAVSEKQINDLCAEISANVLGGAGLEFQLTDSQFKPLRTVSYSPEGVRPEPPAIDQ